MLIFTDIWMLTSLCPFLTPTVSPQPVRIVDCDEILARGFGELGKIGLLDEVYIQKFRGKILMKKYIYIYKSKS